jgi:hypothetical protein
VQNPEFHARTKHIDVSAHYVRELSEDQKISLQYIQTGEMLADMLTKPLKKVRHAKNVEQVGLRAPPEVGGARSQEEYREAGICQK